MSAPPLPSASADIPALDERGFAVTSRSVMAIAIPMTIAHATTPLLGIVDTAVVGRLGGAAPLAGLAVGAVVFDLVFGTLNFIRAGTTGFVAQAFGRGDAPEEEAVFWRGAGLGLAIGILVAILGVPLGLLGAWGMGIAGETAEAARSYVAIRALGAPFSLANYAVLGYVLGRGEAGLGLALQVLLNGTNIVLSITLGLWMGWGIAGVALATVIGEAMATTVGLLILARRFRGHAGRPSWMRVVDRAAVSRLLVVNGDIMIRSFCLIGAFALFARLGAEQGPLTLAANAVLMNLFFLSAYLLDGLATAAEQLAGRAVGAGHRPAFDRSVRLSVLWGFALTGLIFLAYALGGEALIALMTTDAEVRGQAGRFVLWAALTAPAGVLAFQMDGVFIGATWSRTMRNMMLVSLALFAVAAFALMPPLGNHGLWLAMELFLLARGLLLWWRMGSLADRTFG